MVLRRARAESHFSFLCIWLTTWSILAHMIALNWDELVWDGISDANFLDASRHWGRCNTSWEVWFVTLLHCHLRNKVKVMVMQYAPNCWEQNQSQINIVFRSVWLWLIYPSKIWIFTNNNFLYSIIIMNNKTDQF